MWILPGHSFAAAAEGWSLAISFLSADAAAHLARP